MHFNLRLTGSGVVTVGRGQLPPPHKLSAVGKLSENLSVGKLLSMFTNAKFGAENPPFWKNLGSKIEILSTLNFLSRKFPAVCRKITTFCAAYFFNARRRCWQAYGTITVVLHYALPVIIFGYCYAHVFHTIRRQGKVVSGHVGRGQDVPMATTSRDLNTGQVQQQTSGAATAAAASAKLSRTEMNVLKTMIAVIICFIVSWSPGAFNKIVMTYTVR